MTKFYSKSAGGFFDTAVHGSPKMSISDPAWTHPCINITLQHGESFYAIDGTVTTNNNDDILVLNDVLDPQAIPNILVVDNPDCKIPKDAVEVTDEVHTALMADQSEGKLIQADNKGHPVSVDRPMTPYFTLKAEYMDGVRLTREKILSRLAQIAIFDDAMRGACKTARQTLLDLPQGAAIEAAVNMGELKAAVKAAYKAAVLAAPVDLRNAFNEVDV